MATMESEAYAKLERLQRLIGEMDSALVAFSGGVDSTFLLEVCVGVLRGRVLAVTAHSASLPADELSEAIELAQRMGARHRLVETSELDNPDYARNPADRCFHCKIDVFGQLTRLAHEAGLAYVLDGSNYDDISDFRPGARAARQLGVRSPLQEVGLAKDEIRFLSREMGLPTWDKPSAACLSSRIPYGQSITADKLRQIGAAEGYLHDLGFRLVRVRHHGDLARIELPQPQIAQFVATGAADKAMARLKELGFLYVALDLQGYRAGSMNEALTDRSETG